MLFNVRYRQIVMFFGGLTLNVVFFEIILRHLGLGTLATRTMRQRYTDAARRFRALAIRLGGVMIKVGQFLSTRVDVLPYYITQELDSLQDEVPPVPVAEIYAELERELKRPVPVSFPRFTAEPLAAASLGQAHRAELPDGTPVVVKVQRPFIEQVVAIDLAALHTVIQWLKRYRPIARRADLEALFTEFSATLHEELDYEAEARNAEKFRELFAEDERVRIPTLHLEYCTVRVLVMEDVGFIKITDYAALKEAGVSRSAVADRLFETYLRQIFDFGFFHADPHPGNLFVEPATDDHDWRLVFVDFGMVGHITPEIRAALREAVIAVGLRDPKRLMNAFIAVNAVLPDADFERIIAAQTAVFDRYWGKSMGELRNTDPKEVAAFANQFRDLLFELPFQVPRNLIYLGRTVSILSGMCTGLHHDFNLFVAITPFAQTLLAEEFGSEKGLAFWRDQVLDFLKRIVALPSRLDKLMNQLESGDFTVTVRAPRDKDQLPFAAALNRLTSALLAIAFLTVGANLYLSGQTSLGWGGWAIAGVMVVWAMRQ
jgi:predicted unusual protein kinase regulating ubiquinone biosynthesis (AarF/ABC1/UbiB family)